MASAYATLAAGGIRSEPRAIRKVVFPDGKSDDLGKPKRKRVIPDGVAYTITKVLEKNIQAGTAVNANFGCPAAAKTGTTDEFVDAWLVGYTPHLATSVWVGYPNARVSMTSVHGISVQGGSFPAQIWHDYMLTAHGTECDGFPPPTEQPRFSAFYGEHSANGLKSGSGGYYNGSPSTGSAPAPSTGTDTGGNGAGGSKPGPHAPPPQQGPHTQPPPPPPPPGGDR